MTRVLSVVMLLVVALAAPLTVGAQPAGKLPHVAVVFSDSPVTTMLGPDPVHPHMRAFLQAMRALGYVEGQNIVIERRSAEGQYHRFPEIFAGLAQANVDVIVAANTVPVARAARQATRTIPIVIATGLDPVWAGLVTSFARPDGNLTGLTGDAGVPFVGKLLELFKEAVPTLSRVAVLGEMLFDSATKELRAATDKGMRTVADTLRLMLLPVEVERPEQLAAAFATFTQRRADGLLVRSTGFTYAHRKLIVDLATKHRLPSMSVPPEIAEVGGLMAYGPSLLDLYRRAAGYVDKILKGAKPGDLPIERPVKFDLVINLKTAKALGLTIPPAVLARADQVIE